LKKIEFSASKTNPQCTLYSIKTTVLMYVD